MSEPKLTSELCGALKTLRDYISDIAEGELWASTKHNGRPALVKISSESVLEDLARIDAALAKAEGKT